jgi:hypothetical protein
MASTTSSRRRSRASISARQEKAMIEQFGGADRAESEQRNWQRIRRAAAARKLTT